MDIFDKIETMFDDENLTREILHELKEIKNVLKLGQQQYNTQYKKSLPKEYYDFVNNFRNEMQEDQRRGYFPEFVIEEMVLAIDNRKLMYNKETKRYLPKYKAFEIYEKLYNAYIKKEQEMFF